jgi:DNA polymerase-3 subunit gamma/tau
MLSKQAFNGLLKTLEEPPPRLKFILATTEVRKIPVTILSRCQRFDLKRVSLEKLFIHLKNIAIKENGRVTDEALKLIAKAGEGSVRDAISILDRALISQTVKENNEINDQEVRLMLGLADKSKLILIFKEILLGNQKEALSKLKVLIDSGLDAKNFLNDILEMIYLFNRRINLGSLEKDVLISEAEAQLIDQYSKNLDINDLGLFWQLTIKTINDLKIVSNESLALEMYIMQLIHLKEIENENSENDETSKEEKLNTNTFVDNPIVEKDQNNIKESNFKNQLKSTNQLKTKLENKPVLRSNNSSSFKILSFKDLVKIADQEKELELKYDLERNVKLVSFTENKISITFNERLNKNFIKILTEKLLKWTGERWIISLSKEEGKKTFYESSVIEKNSKILEEKNNSTVKEIISKFPDAKLVEVAEEEND